MLNCYRKCRSLLAGLWSLIVWIVAIVLAVSLAEGGLRPAGLLRGIGGEVGVDLGRLRRRSRRSSCRARGWCGSSAFRGPQAASLSRASGGQRISPLLKRPTGGAGGEARGFARRERLPFLPIWREYRPGRGRSRSGSARRPLGRARLARSRPSRSASASEPPQSSLFGSGHRRGLSDAASSSHAIRLPSGLQTGSRP